MFKVGDKVRLNEEGYKKSYLERYGNEIPDWGLDMMKGEAIISSIDEAYVENGEQLYYIDFDNDIGTFFTALTGDLETLDGDWEKIN